MDSRKEKRTPKTLTGRISKQQKLRLLDLMRSNPSVGRGQYTKKSSSFHHELYWKNVATELNAMSGGKKNPEQWKRCWIDWKAAVKKQYNKLRAFNNKTGNRPLSEGPKPLEKIDEDVIQFFSEDLVEGDGDTPEAGFYEETPCTFHINEQDLADAGPSTRIELGAPVVEPSTVEEPSHCIEEPSSFIEEPSQPIEERPTRTSRICLTPGASSLKSSFEEAKEYVGQQNSAMLQELRKINESLANIYKEIKEIKEKLN